MLIGENYIILAVLGFIAFIWALSSMGVIKARDHDLYVKKEKYIEQAKETIEKTFNYLSEMPHNHDKVIEHLDNGRLNDALDAAQTNHDVYHFFKNY